MLEFNALPRAIRTLTGIKRAGVLFAAGGATVLGLPPVDLWPIVFVTFPVLIWCWQESRSRKSAFGAGWWFSFGYFIFGWYWISNALLIFSHDLVWMVPFALVGLPGVMALYYGLASLLVFEITRRVRVSPLAAVLLFAAAFAATDMIRGLLFTGFPWNTFGYLWSGNEALSQAVAFVGVYGLGVFVLVSGVLPSVAVFLPARQRTITFAIALLIPAVLFSGGYLRLSQAPPLMQGDGPGLRLVQTNIPQQEKWRRNLTVRNLEWYLQDSMQGRPDWIKAVIWPETAAAFLIEERHDLRNAAGGLAAPPDGYLITGAPRRPDRRTLHNSLVVLNDIGLVQQTYDKSHLVPFGEYVPLSDFLPLRKITVGALDYTPGPGVQTLSLAGLSAFSPLICYEAIFPGAVVDPEKRPAWLLNLTNDAWYGHTPGPYQHLRHARLRGIEEGLPMVRPANTGISAAFDAYGREIGRIGLGTRGVLDFKLPEALPPTVFSQFGNRGACLLICLVVVVSLMVIKGWYIWKSIRLSVVFLLTHSLLMIR